jgi:hypothetical protein
MTLDREVLGRVQCETGLTYKLICVIVNGEELISAVQCDSCEEMLYVCGGVGDSSPLSPFYFDKILLRISMASGLTRGISGFDVDS